MSTAFWWLAAAAAAPASAAPFWGKAAFLSVFLALLVWLLLLPPHLLGEQGLRRPWWRSPRFWAILVTIVQIGVYAVWG